MAWGGLDLEYQNQNSLYEHIPSVVWSTDIWFKGAALKYVVFCWMAAREDLKTSDALFKRNLGFTLDCPLCNRFPESHSHLFFECRVSYWLIKNLVPNGNYFLLEPNIHRVFTAASKYSHKVVKRLHLLITLITIYEI